LTPIGSFKDLEVWQGAIELAEGVYRVTQRFPTNEQYGLTSQIRRASVSIPSNIAEGHQRTRPAYINHIQIALGSLAEVDTQLVLAVRLRICPEEDARSLQSSIERVGKMLHALLRALRAQTG
jgi:four helix bundle protein